MIVCGPARCKSRNAEVGGALGSRHVFGDALDISTAGWDEYDRARLIGYAIAAGANGIGIHANFIHIDFRISPDVIFWKYI
jgi:uncharacterized protein YcbK (DUF882 family)